jgi:hypothetical protein
MNSNFLKNLALTYLTISILGFGPSAQAATTLTGSAYAGTSMALSSGAHLSNTNAIVLIGTYSIAPTRTGLEAFTSASSFLNNFSTWKTGTMGMDLGGVANYPSGYTSLFSVTLDVPNGVSTYNGKQFYIIVGNQSTIAASTELGVFTKSSWIVVNNPDATVPTPLDQAWDINTLTNADVLFGSILKGTTNLNGDYISGPGAYPLDDVFSQARLQTVIPEPSSMSLMVMGLTSLLALRRKTLERREKCD